VFDIIGKRNWFFAFSLLITIPGLIFILLTPITGGKEGLKFSIDYTGGTRWSIHLANPNVTSDDVKAVLADIQSGAFAARFIADQDAGAPEFKALRAKGEQHPIEDTGRKLRGLMSWVTSDDDYTEGTAQR